MKMNRRQILLTCGSALLSAGFFSSACAGIGEPQIPLTEASIQTDPALHTVASFVKQYSSQYTFRSLSSSGQPSYLVHAHIANLSRFIESFTGEQGIPFGSIRCDGSNMSFRYQQVSFVLCNTL